MRDDFFAPVFLGADLRALVLRPVLLRPALFFAELFLAGLFLAELFFAELFLAVLFFAELFLAGRPDLSVEHHVLLPEFAHLFTDAERAVTRRRLGR